MKRIIIVAIAAAALALTVGVIVTSGQSSQSQAAVANRCVKIGGLRWCFHSSVDEVVGVVTPATALTLSPSGPMPTGVTNVKQIQFTTPAAGVVTCSNTGDFFDCR